MGGIWYKNYNDYINRFPDDYDPSLYYNTKEKFIEIPQIVYNIYPFDINRYLISNWGRLYNKITNTYRPQELIKSINKYVRFELKDIFNNEILVPAHRLVLMSFVGIPVFTENFYANHIDGVRWHNELSNLEWVTNSENVIHAYMHKLNRAQAGDHEYAKLTNEQYHEICRLTQEGYMPKEINSIMNAGIDITGIAYSIRSGNSQKYIAAQYDFSNIYHPDYNRFSKDQVKSICKMLQDGIYDNNVIINNLNIDISNKDKLHINLLHNKINNIKNRISFVEISKDYKF